MLRCKQEPATTKMRQGASAKMTLTMTAAHVLLVIWQPRQVSCITITTSISNRWSHLRLTKRVPACVLLHI